MCVCMTLVSILFVSHRTAVPRLALLQLRGDDVSLDKRGLVRLVASAAESTDVDRIGNISFELT